MTHSLVIHSTLGLFVSINVGADTSNLDQKCIYFFLDVSARLIGNAETCGADRMDTRKEGRLIGKFPELQISAFSFVPP